MSRLEKYDVVVVGGGPGGYTAAFRAADLGLSVCLIEKRGSLGGVCLNEGCIPSKTLLHGASFVEKFSESREYGFSFGEPHIDIDVLRSKKSQVISRLADGLAKLSRARKIERLTGEAVFQSSSSVIARMAGEERMVQFSHAVLATGSSPAVLPNLPLSVKIWDSSDALLLKNVPQKLLIIGGGVIGMEMAEVYHALGSEITVVELCDQILPLADRDLIQPLLRKVKNKYQILTQTRVVNIRESENTVHADFEDLKSKKSIQFDAVLVAVGRKPNSSGIGLSKLGIRLNAKGFIVCNMQQRTSVQNIYAVGDVTGEPMLAHKASHQGKIAAENIAGLESTFQPAAIPSVAYTNPEVAWTGVTEKEAKLGNREYTKGKFPWGASGRALSCGMTNGVTKILFNKEDGRIIGAGVCGSNASELIQEATLAIEHKTTVEGIGKIIHAHPTLAETFVFAAESAHGTITESLPIRRR